MSRFKTGLCLVTLLHLSPVHARQHPAVEAVLEKYGWQSFQEAEEIRFVFHQKLLGLGPSHAWIWHPRSDSVTSVDKGITYSRKSMDRDQRSLDKKFVNDMYWLTFPFHLAMDKGVRIDVDSALSLSPIKKDTLLRLVVTYVQPQGYTPGDRYELFTAPDGLIKEWVYHRHGGKRGWSWTWEDHAAFSGVLFSRDHREVAHLYFTDIAVR